MSFGATKLLAASGGKAYEIDQSLLFDSGDTADLTKTMGAGGNRKTYTISMWLKRTKLGVRQAFIYGGSDNENYTTYADFSANDELDFVFYSTGTGVIGRLKTNRVFRDIASWYHVVLAMDTTESTAGDRMRMYINGAEQTSFSVDTNPSLNSSTHFLNEGFAHYIGNDDVDGYFNGYIAEVNVIDGSQLTPSSFGKTDAVTNAWIPKKYGGAYGTQGFYLKFVSGALGTDSSGEGNNWTANNLANADVLLDTPTNNFCTFNSLDNGSTVLSQGNLKFVNSSGGSDTGNTFAIPYTGKWYFEHRLTVVDAYYAGFLSKGYTGTAGSYSGFTALQIRYDGQWYNGSAFESYASSFSNGDILGWAIDCDNGKVYVSVNGTFANSGNPVNGTNPADTFTATADWKFITYGNSGSQFDANFGQNGTFNGLVTAQGNADGGGIGNFYYAPPSGFKAFSSKNLPTSTIKKSTAFFDNLLYTGDASAKTISGLSFRPDYIWIKNRSDGYHHANVDSTRGATQIISSSQNIVELTSTEQVKTITSDGFTLGDNSDGNNYVNLSSDNYVAWCWRAGGASPSKTYAVKVVSDSGNKYRFDDYGTSAVTLNLQEGGTYTFDQSDSSNATHPLRFSTTSDGGHGGGSEYTTGVTTNGTPGSSGAYTRITVAASAPTLYYYCTAHSGMGGQVNTNSTFGATNLDGSSLSIVSENTTSGFSIVKYVGTGSNATVGHELGVAPSVIILKNRDTDDNWRVFSRGDNTDYLTLNYTNGSTDDNTTWNDTSPTSSVFTIGTDTNTNRSGDDFVAYCFAEVEGFSKFGTYEANNSTNGPFIYTGFTPSWIVFKYIDGAGEWWWMLDSTRDPTNLTTEILYVNATAAESTISGSAGVDFLSNGFKIRATNGGINSANTYFYMAFAEFPFKSANAR